MSIRPHLLLVPAAAAALAGCAGNDPPAPLAPGGAAYFQRLTGTPIAESSPALSPDGLRVAYERGDEIWVLEVATRAARRVAPRGNHPTWTADGTALLFVRRDLDGGGPLHRLVRLDLAAGVVDPVSADSVDAYEPAAAPAGAAVALRVLSRNDTRQTLRVLDAEGGADVATLTEAGTWVDVSPAWSPDGTRIAFVRLADDGTARVMRVDASGDEAPVALTPATAGISGPAFLPDGRIVVSRTGALVVVPAAGGALTELVHGPGFALAPTVAPDGRRLVFASDRSGNFELWQLVDPAGLGAGPYSF